MKFFHKGEKENKTELEGGELKRDPKFMALLEIVGIKIPGYNAPYKDESHTSSVKGNENAETPSGSGERREVKMEAPKNRDEILLEILKELKELNANVKALIVRVDAEREEMRQLASFMLKEIDQMLKDLSRGMGC